VVKKASKDDELGRFLEEVADTWEKKKAFKAAFESAQLASTIIDQVCRAKFPRGTGNLAGSFEPTPAIIEGGYFTAGAYSSVVYAAIRETGGRINKKPGGPNLAVPLTKRAKNTGSPRNWKSNYGVLVYIPPKSKGGNARGVFAVKKGSKKKPKYVAQYMLRKYSDQKGSGYLTEAANKWAPLTQNLIGDAVMNVFAGASVFEVK
tara:strand:+ start:25541 stop:26155 length:615 start_codon:yes stop_codon:yes gene_type:complete